MEKGKKKYNIVIRGIVRHMDGFSILWEEDNIGFGELTIYYGKENKNCCIDNFPIHTESMNDEFVECCLNAYADYIFKHFKRLD